MGSFTSVTPWNRPDGGPPPPRWTMSLLTLDPHGSTRYISQGRTVLAMGTDGFVHPDAHQGLWVRQTRVLRRLDWLVNGSAPIPAGESVLEQDSWLGYYIARPRNWRKLHAPSSAATQQTIALRLRRQVAHGLSETAHVTNWTQIRSRVDLSLQFAADFADPAEAEGRRRQRGRTHRSWSRLGSGHYRLSLAYRASHRYRHQGDAGLARLNRSLALGLRLPPGTIARRRGDRIQISFALDPGATVRLQLRWTPAAEEADVPRRTPRGDRAANLSVPGRSDLAAVVDEAFARARVRRASGSPSSRGT